MLEDKTQVVTKEEKKIRKKQHNHKIITVTIITDYIFGAEAIEVRYAPSESGCTNYASSTSNSSILESHLAKDTSKYTFNI